MPILLLLLGHAAGGRCFAPALDGGERVGHRCNGPVPQPIDEMNGSQEGGSEDRWHPAMDHSSNSIFDHEDSPSSTATVERTSGKGKISKKLSTLKKVPNIDLNLGSGDIENSLGSGISAGLSKVGLKTTTTTDENAMPTPDPKVTKAMLLVAFEKIDTDGSLELDKEEVRLAAAEVGATWNDNQLEQVRVMNFAVGPENSRRNPPSVSEPLRNRHKQPAPIGHLHPVELKFAVFPLHHIVSSLL